MSKQAFDIDEDELEKIAELTDGFLLFISIEPFILKMSNF